ncbi:hypothetical protein [Micromonospora inyonensis]|nr:hypothetical protein [Micromonospora inyonensis]
MGLTRAVDGLAAGVTGPGWPGDVSATRRWVDTATIRAIATRCC